MVEGVHHAALGVGGHAGPAQFVDVITRWRRAPAHGQAGFDPGLQQGQHKQVFDGPDLAPGGGHHLLHALVHVAQHPVFVIAEAAGNVGDGEPPAVAPLRVQGHPIGGIGQHFAMADQKPHRLAPAALQQGWRIKALQGRPKAVAPEEILLGTIEIHGVGDEAAAGARELTGLARGGHVRNREKAAAGDVIHQVQAQLAGGIDQAAAPLLFARVQQDPQGFDRGGTEHHQGGLQPFLGAGRPIDQHHALGLVLAGIHHQMAHHRVAAQLGAAGG